MIEIKVGQKYEKEITVTEKMLAIYVGSGDVSVLATPVMLSLMEEVSAKCLQQFLADDMTSVGTNIATSHIAATPCGMKITAEATISSVNGRVVHFDIKARDEVSLIGEGTHERFIVDREKFNAKAASKLN